MAVRYRHLNSGDKTDRSLAIILFQLNGNIYPFISA